MPGRMTPPMPESDGAAVGDQRIDQRAGGVPGRGMHGEALGLVDDDEVRVLVDDRERDGLRLGLGGLGRRHATTIGLAGFHLAAEVVLDRRPSRRHRAGADQRLQARAAESRADAAPGSGPAARLPRPPPAVDALRCCRPCRRARSWQGSEPALIARPGSLIDVARRARPVRLAVRTSASHVENSGSIPLRGATSPTSSIKSVALKFLRHIAGNF